MELGRNQPCPCGSEKKYKLCCAGKLSSDLVEYHGLLQKEDHIRTKIFQWTKSRFSVEEVNEYMQDFAGENFEDFEEFLKDEDHFPLFLDWLLFEGTMPDTGKSVLAAAREEIALERDEQAIFDQWLQHTQAGVYEIQEVNTPQHYFTIKEMCTEKEYRITDVKGSKSSVRGDFFFGRVQRLFSQYYLSGVLQSIPRAGFSEFKEYLLKKHHWAQLKNPLLSYEKFMNKASKIVFSFTPTVPQLFNPSGEEITVCEATYSLLKPQAEEIVHWFAHDKQFLITEENYSSQGAIISAEIGHLADEEKPTSKEGGTVVFGHWINEEGQKYPLGANLSIKKERVTLFSTSQSEYAALRQKLESQFGAILALKKEQQRPVKEVIAELNDRPRKRSPKRKSAEINSLEEEFYLQYYKEEWCNSKIPLLGNKTPREAVRTKEGKNKVKEMLLDLENEQLHRQREGEEYIPIEKTLKEELNIND